MLRRKIIYKICLFAVMIVFNLCVNSLVLAEDCADKNDVTQTPTGPGNAEYPTGWLDYEPTIYSDYSTINPGGTRTLYVDSGGLAYPPYTWDVEEAGFSIDSTSYNDLDTVTLTAPSASGTCSVNYDCVATVTVTDTCGKTDTYRFRFTGCSFHSGMVCWNGDYDTPTHTDYSEIVWDDTSEKFVRYIIKGDAPYEGNDLIYCGTCPRECGSGNSYCRCDWMNGACSNYIIENGLNLEYFVDSNCGAWTFPGYDCHDYSNLCWYTLNISEEDPGNIRRVIFIYKETWGCP